MSKKQMNKKKLNVKIIEGETAVVLNYDVFLHIAESYDYFASEETDLETAKWYREIADSIRYQSGVNHFETNSDIDEW